MTKLKSVTMEDKIFIKDNFDKAKKVCIEKKDMQALIEEVRITCDYLEKNIEINSLYLYAKEIMLGNDIFYDEEIIVATNIYNDIHDSVYSSILGEL